MSAFQAEYGGPIPLTRLVKKALKSKDLRAFYLFFNRVNRVNN